MLPQEMTGIFMNFWQIKVENGNWEGKKGKLYNWWCYSCRSYKND